MANELLEFEDEDEANDSSTGQKRLTPPTSV